MKAASAFGRLYVLALIDEQEQLAGYVGSVGEGQVVADPAFARKFSTLPDALVKATALSLGRVFEGRAIEAVGYVEAAAATATGGGGGGGGVFQDGAART